MTLRLLLLVSLATLFAPLVPGLANETHAQSVEVWKSPSCACCENWVKHLEADGFAVAVHAAEPAVLARLKREAGIADKLAACHTAKIDGYVPATDIKRLTAERPDAIGLTVPGMPTGSPGMEQGEEAEPYDVLLLKKDGTTELFAHH
jgi:hypothetical protein